MIKKCFIINPYGRWTVKKLIQHRVFDNIRFLANYANYNRIVVTKDEISKSINKKIESTFFISTRLIKWKRKS